MSCSRRSGCSDWAPAHHGQQGLVQAGVRGQGAGVRCHDLDDWQGGLPAFGEHPSTQVLVRHDADEGVFVHHQHARDPFITHAPGRGLDALVHVGGDGRTAKQIGDGSDGSFGAADTSKPVRGPLLEPLAKHRASAPQVGKAFFGQVPDEAVFFRHGSIGPLRAMKPGRVSETLALGPLVEEFAFLIHQADGALADDRETIAVPAVEHLAIFPVVGGFDVSGCVTQQVGFELVEGVQAPQEILGNIGFVHGMSLAPDPPGNTGQDGKMPGESCQGKVPGATRATPGEWVLSGRRLQPRRAAHECLPPGAGCVRAAPR
jgi:hypothetical protein